MPGHEFEVVSSATEYSAFRFAINRDTVVMPGGEHADRVYMRHPGAVGVAAVDETNRVALVRQYRHPVRQRLWEVPAGLRDVEGEDPAVTALRELGEEADLRAGRVDHLLDFYPSPGSSNERILVYLARDLTEIPVAERHSRDHEEADLELAWWHLKDAVDAVLSGEIRNGLTVAAVLAAARVCNVHHSL